MYKLHGNQKPKIYNTYTDKKKEFKHNTKIVIKSKGKKLKKKKGTEKNYQSNPKIIYVSKHICLKSYFKCKLTQYPSQKTYGG